MVFQGTVLGPILWKNDFSIIAFAAASGGGEGRDASLPMNFMYSRGMLSMSLMLRFVLIWLPLKERCIDEAIGIM